MNRQRRSEEKCSVRQRRLRRTIRQWPQCIACAMTLLASIVIGACNNTSTPQDVCQDLAKPDSGYITPYAIRQAYGVQSLCRDTAGGKGQTIVVIAFGGLPSTLDDDLAYFDKKNGLPPVQWTPYWPHGDPEKKGADQGGNHELELDIESIHAMAPNAHVAIVATSTPPAEVDDTGLETLLLVSEKLQAHILSMSFGISEFYATGTKPGEVNATLQRMAGEGWSLIAASGDNGAYGGAQTDGDWAKPENVVANFPASSPWVTAAGGTRLSFANTASGAVTVSHEDVWNDSTSQDLIKADSRSGGGLSRLFPEPDYQRLAFPAGSTIAGDLHGMRAVPDVSADASGRSSLEFREIGLNTHDGGTSEAAPLWAGMVALANQKAGHPLGFLNPALYHLGATAQSTYFHDIQGNVSNKRNGHEEDAGYKAVAGYDLVTGWGSPKGDALFPALIAYSMSSPTPSPTSTPDPHAACRQTPGFANASDARSLANRFITNPATGEPTVPFAPNTLGYVLRAFDDPEVGRPDLVVKFEILAVCSPAMTADDVRSFFAAQMPQAGWYRSNTFPYGGDFSSPCGDPYCWAWAAPASDAFRFASLESVQQVGSASIYQLRLGEEAPA